MSVDNIQMAKEINEKNSLNRSKSAFQSMKSVSMMSSASLAMSFNTLSMVRINKKIYLCEKEPYRSFLFIGYWYWRYLWWKRNSSSILCQVFSDPIFAVRQRRTNETYSCQCYVSGTQLFGTIDENPPYELFYKCCEG